MIRGPAGAWARLAFTAPRAAVNLAATRGGEAGDVQGGAGRMNHLYYGDNLTVLRHERLSAQKRHGG